MYYHINLDNTLIKELLKWKMRNYGIGPVEIGWDTSAKGLQNLADQMGLKLINGTSSYSIDGKKPYFIEE